MSVFVGIMCVKTKVLSSQWDIPEKITRVKIFVTTLERRFCFFFFFWETTKNTSQTDADTKTHRILETKTLHTVNQ